MRRLAVRVPAQVCERARQAVSCAWDVQVEVKFKAPAAAGQRGGRKAAGDEAEHAAEPVNKDGLKVPYRWA